MVGAVDYSLSHWGFKCWLSWHTLVNSQEISTCPGSWPRRFLLQMISCDIPSAFIPSGNPTWPCSARIPSPQWIAFGLELFRNGSHVATLPPVLPELAWGTFGVFVLPSPTAFFSPYSAFLGYCGYLFTWFPKPLAAHINLTPKFICAYSGGGSMRQVTNQEMRGQPLFWQITPVSRSPSHEGSQMNLGDMYLSSHGGYGKCLLYYELYVNISLPRNC